MLSYLNLIGKYLFLASLFALNSDEDIDLEPMVDLSEEVEMVTLTTYTPSVAETDSTPLITASGFKINEDNPSKHRIIAVSRDLKRKYKFGTKVKIKNAGKYNGTYTIRDVMNKRYKKRIDILIGKNDSHTKLHNVKLYPLDTTK